uniref:Leucine rich immune protein (Short) n=1 Tax=Anopheles maculatus TaxID=74869 RepID=A0A182SKC7_9DIPT
MTLVVDHNLLTSIDMDIFGHLSNLRVLSMADNLLLTVTSPPDAPIHLIKLRRLSFAGNQLAMLDIRTWELDSLEVFNVTGNSLTRIEGSFTKLPVLRRLELARNRWYCEWLMMLYTDKEAAPGFKLDSDEPDRCRNENMMTSHHHCCNPAGADGSGLIDVFGDKWEELQRLAYMLDALNNTIVNGSTAVNRLLANQNTALSTQVTKISQTQQEQAAQLKELENGIDRLKDRLSNLQIELQRKVDWLSQEVNGRWNQTNAESEEQLNTTKMATPTTNWPVVASDNEKNLSRLRELLVTTNKQFNDYAGRSYEQEALVKSQVERISSVQQELEKERLNGEQMQQQLDNLAPTVELIYKFLRDVRDGCVDKLD